MPTCPGCGEPVTYGELRRHVGACKFVWSETPEQTDRLSERLASQIARLEERISRVDADRSKPPETAGERREQNQLR